MIGMRHTTLFSFLLTIWIGLNGSSAIAKPPIYLTSYGYIADNSTNNTNAVNAAVTAAVAGGGDVSLIVPNGIGLVGATDPILGNNITFICEGAPGACTMKGIASGMLQWGTTTASVENGGTMNVGFDGNGSASQILIYVPYAARMRFDNARLTAGMTNFLTLGSSSGNVNTIDVNGLMGPTANIAVPLINLVRGSGLFVNNANVFTVATQGAAAAGRSFITASNYSWDTISLNGGAIQTFDTAMTVNAASSTPRVIIQNIWIGGTWMDGLNRGLLFISGNQVYGVNQANAGAAALLLNNTGTTNATIVGNNLGIDLSSTIVAGAAAWGAYIAGGSSFVIAGNNAKGTVGNWYVGVLENSNVVGQKGLSNQFSDPIIVNLMTPPSSSAPCTTGQINWDANYVYVCVTTNT